MKWYRAFLSLLLAAMLAACAKSSTLGRGQPDTGIRAPRPPASATQMPREISTDLSKSADSKSTDAAKKKPVLPSVTAKPSYGLMSPASDQKPEKLPLSDKEKQKVVLNFEKADVAEVTNQIFGD